MTIQSGQRTARAPAPGEAQDRNRLPSRPIMGMQTPPEVRPRRMHSCLQVANRLLQLAHGAGATLTPMQLIKLVYMCHGWMLGLYGRPLIQEQVQAWKFGPVIPELYRHLRQYGGGPVTRSLPCPEQTEISRLEANLIEQVYMQ